MDVLRRSFLRGKLERSTMPVRPPWNVPESLFTQLCTRCGDCIQQCETGILKKGDGGFPETFFDEAGCSFCEKCVQACKSGALRLIDGATPWQLKAFINASCLAQQKVVCRTCGERCETDALRFRLEKGGVATPQIDLDRCNGCGMCVADCPVHAITLHSTEHLEEALV
jgi:ferredoxin-type protein NapF